MTEFEAACEFVRQYAHAVLAAGRGRGPTAEWSAFWRYCVGWGIEPTEERLSLARDLMAAARGYVACPVDDAPAAAWVEEDDDDEPDPADSWKPVAEVPLDLADLGTVPPSYLAETLAVLGWREGFLGREVRG
jgi:hypothetical protein